MPEVTPPSPEQPRSVPALARAFLAAARTWSLYPQEHPAVGGSVDRLAAAIRGFSAGQSFALTVTPDTLIVNGHDAPAGDGPVAEAAAWLHQRDVLQLTFLPAVPLATVRSFLGLLSEDVAALRERGGPARAWADGGDIAITIEQIDFSHVLEDRDVQHPARRRDDVWRAIVRAVLERRKQLDDAAQQRLLEISQDIVAIGDLARDVMAPHSTADGSPMLTSQAAAIMAAYRHLVGIVDVMAPDRRAEVMRNIAAATASMDPRLTLQVLGAPDAQTVTAPGPDVRRGVADSFDDEQVARLLAAALSMDGQASGRLAEVFDTIVPDEPRKRRVLTLTRSLLGETAFGKGSEFTTLWVSTEELLLTYNERPFVSAAYKAGLDGAAERAQEMAAAELPEELGALVHTLGQDNIRRLSVTLLIDLLHLEKDAARAPELARDVAALCEDLLLAGDYEEAVLVTEALATHAARPRAVTREGSRVALDALARTPAIAESAELLGDMQEVDGARFAKICEHVGPGAIDVLLALLDTEPLTTGRERAAAIVRAFGTRAVSRLAPLVSNGHWYAQRNAAELLGEIGGAEAVPLLQPLLRGSDPRVTQAAVRALASIDDPAAARAVHTVLRAAAGQQRQAVVAALVAERDPRVVPVLVRILNESEPFGDDHPIVLDTLGALAQIGGDQAVPHVVVVMKRRKWLARRKVRALKQTSLDALRTIGSPAARAAIADAAVHGDRLLRRLAKGAGAGARG